MAHGMESLHDQQSKSLAEINKWSLKFAQGFLRGEESRHIRVKLSSFVNVGIDDYCQGFRAGYFGRTQTPDVSDGRPDS